MVDIGRVFGGKDHTTVMNALQRVDFLQNKDLDIKNDIDELTTRIHNITGCECELWSFLWKSLFKNVLSFYPPFESDFLVSTKTLST